MLGRLSNNPNVLRSIFKATFPNGTFDLWIKGRPLKHPILNDRFNEGYQVGVYPKSAHVRMIQFQIIFIFAHLG